MGRSIAALIIAFLLWTALWLGFTSLAQSALPEIVDPQRPLTNTGVLVAFVVYSAVISVAAGYTCAAVKGLTPMGTVWTFAVIQLVVGIGVEASYWDMMPSWYHLAFLALIVPATVWGGRLRAARRVGAS